MHLEDCLVSNKCIKDIKHDRDLRAAQRIKKKRGKNQETLKESHSHSTPIIGQNITSKVKDKTK